MPVKKIFQKYGLMLAMSLAVLAVLLFCTTQTQNPFLTGNPHGEGLAGNSELVLGFRVSGAPQPAELSVWQLSEEEYYVFLPSFARLQQVHVSLPQGMTARVGDVELVDGMDCAGFALETAYPLSVNGTETGTLGFVRSENVPALYIETVSGSMADIHADKEHEESAAMTLVSPDGVLLHADEAALLKGRGNVTWLSEKKPYLLTLSADADLLDMGSASKWVLLANTVDETNLRNKLIYDLAAASDFPWTPQVSYVDVYLNGQYNGLYLLAEKVEAGPNRLNLDTQNGDFLCRVEADYRWGILKFPIRTPSGRTVEISEPGQLTTGRKNVIADQVARMEDTIYSGEDLTAAAGFDLDSWVRRYLVDEISGNIDADLASSYFYSADGVIYGGPIWDYDKVFGNTYRNENPETFIAKNKYVSATIVTPYYHALFENESFQTRLREIYRAEFRPALEQMMNGGIRERAQFIALASRANNLRWQRELEKYYASGEIIPSDVDSLSAYLEKRIAFLDAVWIQEKEYCTVQLEYSPGGPYWNIAVEKGTALADSPVDVFETVWYDNWTGEAAGPDTVIEEDRILTVRYEAEKETTMVVVTRLSLLVMAVMLVILLVADRYLRRKERRKDHERTDARIPS